MRLKSVQKFMVKKRIGIILLLLLILVTLYSAFFHTLTISPLDERDAMQQLETAKERYPLSPFETDGCSGGISDTWNNTIRQFSAMSNSFAERYSDVTTIPFEEACIRHDRAYHAGSGGYAGRLEADNMLRTDILSYAAKNTELIQERTGLDTPEEALYLYEIIADSVYSGVRLGGAPCTGQTYAWGYGYNNGTCE